jgi:hypothetical protein
MWHDSIIEKIRKRREKHAARFEYNAEAIIKALQIDEKKSGRTVVSFAQPRLKKQVSSTRSVNAEV